MACFRLFTSLYCTLPLLALLLVLFSSSSYTSLAIVDESSLSSPVPKDSICKSTPYPNHCKSVLPSNKSSNVYDYGRFSVSESLSSAKKFLRLVNKYLRDKTLSVMAVRALEDCQLLAELNIDFLLNSSTTVNSTQNLATLQADDVQTLLSAILTNQQTCLDGLQTTSSAWNVKDGLYTPLSNNTMLYSVSLALFTKGWVHKQKKTHQGRELMMFSRMGIDRNGRFGLRMKNHHREIYESISGRKLAQHTTQNQVKVRDMVVVKKDGSGNFTTIHEALAAAPNNTNITDGYFMIYVVAGVYDEYVTVGQNKLNVMMVGDGIRKTVITGNRSVADGWTTFNSATFIVLGQRFVAVNMTFRNTAGANKSQAVAVRNSADLSTFYKCSFEAYQDTLYAHSLRQFYSKCDIYGTIDFIFGNAAAVFQSCDIYARLPLQQQYNTITAQGRTDPNQNTGTSLHGCKIRSTVQLASSNRTVMTFLGRPWRPYSRTVIMQSFIDGLVDPAGWIDWGGNTTDLSSLYYAEFNNTGTGAVTTNRVQWPGYHLINATDASNFTVSGFLLGDRWLNGTGVPYTAGFLKTLPSLS
ncbi:probable pectinesterase/pectinesterase inhibitor 41 [Telopea speciosissima]|uniref:probable pectinesterase/pectinesterase inhibitor 41 n=1 Tax=Telopea speciosissima TaxID=54955 RepID=UPI001CC550B3|nr:probable pectinesterase/pectinesterase inhibitor 41 [Telopea speciosissima]